MTDNDGARIIAGHPRESLLHHHHQQHPNSHHHQQQQHPHHQQGSTTTNQQRCNDQLLPDLFDSHLGLSVNSFTGNGSGGGLGHQYPPHPATHAGHRTAYSSSLHNNTSGE